MIQHKTVASLAIASALVLGTMATLAMSSMAQQQPVYGSQMMTEQERMEYQQRMKSAKTEQEREQIRAEHHVQMQERAKNQGITLPDNPPMKKGTGSGMKSGSGMGSGMKSGSGMGTGSGKGMKKKGG
jgi:hypothetical protein